MFNFNFFYPKAREFLYNKIYGKQCITPVAIMTSSAKNNHKRIVSLCERFGWFGRGRSNFQLFEQVYPSKISDMKRQYFSVESFFFFFWNSKDL